MKINRLETHDRLEYFVEDQSKTIFQGADDCMRKNPLSLALQEKCPYIYIFAHARSCEDGKTKRLLWQPRLTKPKAQTNSMLFRAISNSDLLEICWIIPQEELWDQYEKGNITEEPTVVWSIHQYLYNRKELEKKHSEDLSDKKVNEIYKEIKMNNKITKLKIEEVSSDS